MNFFLQFWSRGVPVFLKRTYKNPLWSNIKLNNSKWIFSFWYIEIENRPKILKWLRQNENWIIFRQFPRRSYDWSTPQGLEINVREFMNNARSKIRYLLQRQLPLNSTIFLNQYIDDLIRRVHLKSELLIRPLRKYNFY